MSDLKAQRAQRLEELKKVMKEVMLKVHADLLPEAEVVLTDDAAIDLFGIGVLDSSPEEWQVFLKELQEAEPEIVPEDEVPEAAKESLRNQQKKEKRERRR